MTCSEFQKVLPYIIETGGNSEEQAHLTSCAVCSDLVQDLKYIAEQAKLLVPMEDPSPRVWTGIKGALEREGLVRPVRGTGRFRAAAILTPARWTTAGGLLALAAVLVIAVGLITYHNNNMEHQAATAAVATTPAAAPVAGDADDSQLLTVVRNNAPSMLDTYQDNLRSINDYIAAARARIQQNPDDEQARDFLMHAYAQKTMLYEMALTRVQQ